jgi:tryptophan synthase beta subunit
MAPNEAHLNNEGNLSGGTQPDADGYFGSGDSQYGGAYLPPPLVPVMKLVDVEYNKIKNDPEFLAELADLRKRFIGRPSPIYECKNLSEKIGGATIFLKREDLNHTGSHKINHCLGEALLAKKMGKSKLIAETGAGQHGVALATVASLFQLECEIHMGEIDIKKGERVLHFFLLLLTIQLFIADLCGLCTNSCYCFNLFIHTNIFQRMAKCS